MAYGVKFFGEGTPSTPAGQGTNALFRVVIHDYVDDQVVCGVAEEPGAALRPCCRCHRQARPTAASRRSTPSAFSSD